MINIIADVILMALFVVLNICFFFFIISDKWLLIVMDLFVCIYIGINHDFIVEFIKACLLFVVGGEFNLEVSVNQLVGSLFIALLVLIISIYLFFVFAAISSEERR